MKPEGSLLRLQEPATCSSPEPDQFSPCPPPHFLKIYLNIILPATPGSSKLFFPWGFPTKILHTMLLFPYVLYSPPISSNKKVSILIRSRSEFQNCPASFRTPKYRNFLTSIRPISVEQNTGFILIPIVLLHVCYMSRPFLRPSSDMSI